MLATLVAIIGVPLALAAFVLVLPRVWAGRVALLAPATSVLLAIPLWRSVLETERTIVSVTWFPTLDLTANLVVDRLGIFFVLLIGGIGLAVVQFARHYMPEKATPGFWALLLAFMGSMLGIVLSDSLLLLFVFWEMTTITSALLIGMEIGSAEARRGAIQAFLVTGTGGLALLGGIVLTGTWYGSYDLSSLALQAEVIAADPRHVWPLGLLLLGAFTKSAQFPFHFWLPGAMAAPAPISAYLHSATMVKAGVFLLGRLLAVYGLSEYWLPTLAAVGLTTFVVAGWHAVRAYDAKQLLAYSTVAYLGVLTAFYGFASRTGLQGELLNIANHALYKSSLFLLLGWMEKTMGTRDLGVLSRERWWRREPLGFALIGIGALSMMGVPFLLGFMAKEVFFTAVAGTHLTALTWPMAAASIGSALAAIYALKLWAGTFFGSEEPPDGRGYPRKKISPWLLIVPMLLLVPQVVGGLIPGWLLGGVLERGEAWDGALAFWRYFDATVALKLGLFATGIGLYFVWPRLAALPIPAGPQRAAEGLAEGALGFAGWLGRTLQAGGHPRFIAVTLVFGVAMLPLGAMYRGGGLAAELRGLVWGPDVGLAWIPAVAISAAALLTVWVGSRITMVVMMALVGYGMAVFYVLFRAPDLALTQLLVETVSLILILLIFRRLPPLARVTRERPLRKLVHVLVSCFVGAGMGLFAWLAGTHGAAVRAGAEHAALSLPVAKGHNVVNVILVDFRGMDTLGEILVLAIAAVGAVALFRAGRGTPDEVGR
jgi:multicomponent K+:H+ antiporter subunit A